MGAHMDDTNARSCPILCPATNDHQRLPSVPIAFARTWMTRKINSSSLSNVTERNAVLGNGCLTNRLHLAHPKDLGP
jgi:hypothetical protein